MDSVVSHDNKISYSDIGKFLYFLALGVYLFYAELVTTNFTPFFDLVFLRKIYNISTIILISIKIIVFDHYTVKELMKIMLFVLLGAITTIVSHYDIILITYLFVVGAKDISLYKIVKFQFIIVLIFVVSAFFASQAGIIENTITYRDNIPRQSFGIVYCTDFAAHIFYLMISYIYLIGNKLKYGSILILSVITIWVYRNCDARLDCICMLVLILFLFYRKIKSDMHNIPMYQIPKTAWLEKLLMWSMPICALFSVSISYFFNTNSTFWTVLNGILNNRLTQGSKALKMYSFNMFGQIVEVQGQVGINTNLSDYFFIDSSYLLYGLRYGIVFLLVLCFGSLIFMKRELKKNNAIFCILFFLIAVNSCFSHHLAELAYNPFILFFFADTIYHPNINDNCNRKRVIFMI